VSAGSRFERRLAALAANGRKALVPFITAGDPGRDATVPVLHALVEAGADLIELGVPFSDPMADGVVIQKSSERALERGINAPAIFAMVAEFRQRDADTPIVLMGYLNPIERRGWAWYAEHAAAAGADALLIVDLPPEESASVRQLLNRHGLQLITLLAPTTDGPRLADACAQAQGYLYYVSMAGVTGKDLAQSGELTHRVGAIRAAAPVPVYVGFGIKDAATAKACAAYADGVIVGSALVASLAECRNPAEAEAAAKTFLAPLRHALDGL
jgi:tryptophan synthase alpha chain